MHGAHRTGHPPASALCVCFVPCYNHARCWPASSLRPWWKGIETEPRVGIGAMCETWGRVGRHLCEQLGFRVVRTDVESTSCRWKEGFICDVRQHSQARGLVSGHVRNTYTMRAGLAWPSLFVTEFGQQAIDGRLRLSRYVVHGIFGQSGVRGFTPGLPRCLRADMARPQQGRKEVL